MAKKNYNIDKGFEENNIVSSTNVNLTTEDIEIISPVSSAGARRRPKQKRGAKMLASFNVVPFQGVPFPYQIETEDQLMELEEAAATEGPVYLVPLLNPAVRPGMENLCPFGVETKVMKVIDMPDGKKNAFLIGGIRVKIEPEVTVGEGVFLGAVKKAEDRLTAKEYPEFLLIVNLVEECYEYVKNYFSEMARIQMAPPKELQDDRKVYLNFMIITSPIEYKERLELFSEPNLYKRAKQTLVCLEKVRQQIDLRKEIFSKTSADIEREQRDQFLRAQIRQMQNEIGEGEENDFETLINRAEAMNWPAEARKHFDKELNKLRRYNPTSPDYAIEYGYLDTLLSLPWNRIADSQIDLAKLERDLDRDHYGLEKVKERIMEHMAVLKLRGDMRSPILCLYGPPGVGKTSLCRSVAESINREYARISLGGLHDETEIRGHRRTYIGALPGRLITALTKIDTNNPVFVLDEIDKIGNDHRGDPAQALLEVLDPEQNSRFHDNYLDFDYDLSKVFFIATANNISTISPPLLDRMELINISGYIPEEKIEIAKRHLVPKLLENHGFENEEVSFTDDAINFMIDAYTRESGVRKLEKTISKALRKIAVKKAKGEPFKSIIGRQEVLEMLGKEDVVANLYEGSLPVGVVAGLAWTPVGGEILYFESSLSKGKGTLTLTGNMGDVMKESATIALQWVKANAERLGIDPERFQTTDVHLHVPEGAVPKDGPSAGITMISSLVSSFTGKAAKDGVAMTGEITLSGKVLPVGGVKEKILAAKRAGIREIILSEKNIKDIEEINEQYVEGLTFRYVKSIMDVIDIILGSDLGDREA